VKDRKESQGNGFDIKLSAVTMCAGYDDKYNQPIQ
jgi:hypothetical protein